MIYLEITENRVKVQISDFKLNLVYSLKTPEHTYVPEKISSTPNEIIAEFPQGIIKDQLEWEDGNLIINREWDLNHTGDLRLIFEINCSLQPTFYLIPGMVVNGNKQGEGNYPKPKISEKHSFREDRCAVPSCGIMESSRDCIGLFTEPSPNEEFMSSISIFQKDSNSHFEISIPWEEQPVRYVAKFRKIDGLTNFFSLNGKFNYQRKFFIAYRVVKGESRGYYDILRYSWKILARASTIPSDWSDWMRRKVQLAANPFYVNRHGTAGFITTLTDPLIPLVGSISGGFAGKNVEIAYCLYRMYLLNKEPKLKEIALKTVNFLTSKPLPNGLFYSDYNFALRRWYGYAYGLRRDFNTRMMGEMSHALLKFYLRTKDHGDANEQWYLLAKNFCEFMLQHQRPNGSFGKWWSKKGELLEDSGTNGAYVIWTLAEFYKLTNEERYRSAAVKAGTYYIDNFVKTDEYWGDTLDADAIDKEAGIVILRAMLYLFEITNEKQYLDAAIRAGHFVSTWQVIYKISFPEGSTFALKGFDTFGGTIVSVENMHMDPYIAFTFDFLKLWRVTDDPYWKERAIAGLEFALQMVASKNDTLGKRRWFIGLQPEQFNHTTWCYVGPSTFLPRMVNPKGTFKGSMLAWVLAVTMGTVWDLTDEFPDLIEIHPQPIEFYKSLRFKISRWFRDLILRLNPL